MKTNIQDQNAPYARVGTALPGLRQAVIKNKAGAIPQLDLPALNGSQRSAAAKIDALDATNAPVRVEFKHEAPSAPRLAPPGERHGVRSAISRTVQRAGHGAYVLKHGHSMELSGGAALGVVAGAHGYPELFAYAMSRASAEDVPTIVKAIGHKPFFSEESLRAVVQKAAMETLSKAAESGSLVRTAHELIAVHLATLAAQKDGIDNAANLFDGVMNIAGPGHNPSAEEAADSSAYAGALAGLCLAGVLRYGKNHDSEIKHHQEHFVRLMNIAASSIGNATFPGVSSLTGLMSAGAEPLARRIFKEKSLEQPLIALGGDIEAAVRRGDPDKKRPSGFSPEEFCDLLQETIHRCGFPF